MGCFTEGVTAWFAEGDVWSNLYGIGGASASLHPICMIDHPPPPHLGRVGVISARCGQAIRKVCLHYTSYGAHGPVVASDAAICDPAVVYIEACLVHGGLSITAAAAINRNAYR